ncbi:winged helix-turn-helix transcriptional regulator [Chryseobacterium viscerum]|uniref:Transcriptional regulator n=1 Tax=Chryseobacterium viscerum TaxID=1037377 RepID=A0A316WDH6_9FLAO|nr:helix-turn-helix domain-containing protein [Chryseobacterium viscerum]PWN58373.1 transcriptional regulator [Chryseobacterium viscerum]
MSENKKRSDCPVSQSLDIWGDKWSLLIVRDLMFAGQCTYGDFQKSEEKIASNILASRLQMLEDNGIIIKGSHPESKVKFLYKLTAKGIDLLPLMIEINMWAEKYCDISSERKELLQEVKKDKEVFIVRLSKKLKSLM